jgi:hypothetical protein
MFDVIIFANTAVEPVAQTLATLVEGVVADSVKRVIVVAPLPHEELSKLADSVGCEIMALSPGDALVSQLLDTLTTQHTLTLNAGALLPPGWPELVQAEFRQRGMPGSAVAVLFKPEPMIEWVKLLFLQTVKGRFSPNYGALIPRTQLLSSELNGIGIKVMNGPVQMSQIVTRYIA